MRDKFPTLETNPDYETEFEDPLVLFSCLNPDCDHTFTPQVIMIEEQKVVRFQCPFCKSQYEARYALLEAQGVDAMMLTEVPRMIKIGTKIASS